MLYIQILALAGILIAVACFEDEVEGLSSYDHFHYGTKTSYNLAYPQMASFIKATLDFQDQGGIPEQCNVVQINMVFRHGTRHPSHGDVSKIENLLNKLNTMNLKSPELKSWTNNHTLEVEKRLTESGMDENRAIAQRLFGRYGELISKALADFDRFNIYSSETQRSEASAAAFIEGLIDSARRKRQSTFHKKIDNRVTLRNDLLRFFDLCRRYIESMDDSYHWLHEEFDLFKNSAPMVAAAARVSKRLFHSAGDTESEAASISPGDMKVIWALCGCELAINGLDDPAPWCELLSKNDRKVLEYYWDLKSYWKKSYGESLNYRQSCPLLQHLYENINAASSKTGSSLLNLYFGHAETLLPLQALLGLFKDAEELNVANYERLADHRLFRSSFMVPFAGNLGLYLFKCRPVEQNTHSMWPQQLDKYMLQLQLNEHVIPFPFTNQSAISLARFEEQYLNEIKSCDFGSLCKSLSQQNVEQKQEAKKVTTPNRERIDLKKELKKPVEEEAYPPQVPNIELNQVEHNEL